MNHEESLSQLERLLNKVPGIEVESHSDTPEYTCIKLAVRLQKSLARLAYHSCMANVSVHVLTESPSARYVGLYDPEALRYVLDIPKDLEPDEPPNRLQILGIILARDLKVLGLLAAEEADRLQRAWNAVVM